MSEADGATRRPQVGTADPGTACDRHYRAIFESAVDFAIIATDREGRVTDWNVGAERVLGWSAEEMRGQPAGRFFTPEDRTEGRPGIEMRQALEVGRAGDERWHVRRDGARFWANGEMMPLKGEDGAHLGFLKILRDRTEQRRAAEAQRADAEFLRGVLAASADCIEVLALDGRLTFMSEGGRRLMEVCDFNAIQGRPWMDLWEGEGRTQARAAMEAAKAGGTGHFQGFARTMAGTPKWWDVQVTPIRGADGRPEELLCVSRDITATRRAEAEREAVLGSIADGFATLDAEWRLTYVNAAAERLLSTRKEDLLGKDHWALYPAVLGTVVEREYRRAMTERVPVALENFYEPWRRWYEIRVYPASDGGLATYFQDITARKAAEAALRRRAEEFQTLADNIPTLCWMAHADGRIHWYNRRWYEYTGTDPASQEGWGWESVHDPEVLPQVLARWRHSLASGEPFEMTFPLRGADGVFRPFLTRIVPIRGEDGQIVRWFGTNTDITEQRAAEQALRELTERLELRVDEALAERAKAEEQLRQSQKMEAVGQLTGGLAHDFNNLLTAIAGSLERMQTRLSQGRVGDLDRYIVAAQGASKRAAALTHRLLAFSRRQTLDPKPVDINRLVAGMEELIRRTVGPSVTVEFVGAGGLWASLVDPHQLENALLNLCINARDAMPEGGRLTVETANRWLDARVARERDLAPGQYVSLCVSDTGTGMAPDVIARAFDPFFTTKPIGLGTGLGLSMVYGFARQSGGQARIYSEPGQGTMVCLYLPRHHGGAGEVEAPVDLAEAAARAEQGKAVLVVDDEPTVRMLVAEVLEELGYATVEAADGSAGLRVLRSDARLDLLITDVGLPGGMNGRQVADAGREVRPELKVLFITGFAENAVIGSGHLEPGMQVLTKPFAMETLADRVKDLVAEA